LIGLIFLWCFNIAQCSTSTTNWTTQSGLQRIVNIGSNLLIKNNLPTKITFKILETDEVNAYASGENTICVYTGLLKFVDNDEELAGVISHEMGHIINRHVAKQSIISTITSTVIAYSPIGLGAKTGAYVVNKLSMLKMSRSEEYEADITGVDLMKNAGYNPLGMVSVLYKISGKSVDFVSTHPSGDKRTMYIYNYITYAYPDFVNIGYSTVAYKQFMTYATPIVEKRNSSQSKIKAFNKKQDKLQKKRISKMKKYTNSKNGRGWTASYTLLKSITGE
jgi:hypothetical protein